MKKRFGPNQGRGKRTIRENPLASLRAGFNIYAKEKT
jgi:hypothetical protein